MNAPTNIRPNRSSPIISQAQLATMFQANASRIRVRNLAKLDAYVAAQIRAAKALPGAEADARLRRAVAHVQGQVTALQAEGFNRYLGGLTAFDLSNAISDLEAAR